MKTGDKGKELIKGYEKLYLRAYDDFCPTCAIESPIYKVRGTLTIGYGSTGSWIRKDSLISKVKAEELFEQDLLPAEATANKLIKITLTQNQFDALVSFAFNCGGYYHSKKLNKAVPYDLWNYINSGKTIEEIGVKWIMTAVTSKGKEMKGLVNRRTAEFELFNTI